MKDIQPHLNTEQLPLALKAKQEVARFQSSLLDLAGIPVRHNIHSIGGHTSDVRDLALTPDGKRFVSAGYDNTARLWDLESGRSLMVYRGHVDNVRTVTVSPDGDFLATGSVDGCIKIWDLETGVCRRTWQAHSEWVRSLVFGLDGADLFSGGGDGPVKQWSIASGELAREFKGHTKAVWAVALLPDGKMMLSAAEDGSVRQWHIRTGECIRVFEGVSPACHSLCLHPSEPRFYVGGADGLIGEWNLETGVYRRGFSGHSRSVESLVLSPDGAQLVSASQWDETVRIWDLESGLCNFTHGGPGFVVNQAGFTGDGNGVVFCAGKRAAVLERLTGNCLMNFDSQWTIDEDTNRNLQCFHLSPTGRLLAAGSWNGIIIVWDMKTGRMLHRLTHPDLEPEAVMGITVSRDETYLISGDFQGRITVWDLQTGSRLKWFRAHPGIIYGVALADADSALLTCGRGFEDNIRAWDFPTLLNIADAELLEVSREPADEIRNWQGYLAGFWGHRDTVFGMDPSPDGRLLATGSGDRRVKLWNLAEGLALARNLKHKKISCTHTPEEHPQWIQSVRFSSDGRKLASGCNDGKVRVFDPETGRLIKTLSGCAHFIYAVDFTPDGRKILAGSWDQTIKVWDLDSGMLEEEYRGNDSRGNKAIFIPGGNDILVTGINKIRRWDARRNHLEQDYSGSLEPVSAIAINAQNGKLVMGTWEGRIKQLNLSEAGVEWSFKTGCNRFPVLFLSAAGNKLVLASYDGMADIKEISTGDGPFSRFPHPDTVNAVWLSPSGRTLFTACADGLVRRWDTQNRDKIEFHGHDQAVNALAINRAETLLYTAGADGTIRCWDPWTGQCLQTYSAHRGPVNHILLSWDEKLLYSGGQDGTIKVWDLRARLPLSDFGTGAAVTAMILNHKTQVLVTGGADGGVKAWEPFSGVLRKEFTGHDRGRIISGLGFDRNGDRLVSAGRDATVRFWDLEQGELLATFHNLERGFLWTTPPDALAPFGWFWTDQPELINIFECDENGRHPRILQNEDPLRREYLTMYHQREMVVNRLNHYEKYRRGLMAMNRTIAAKQPGCKPAALLGENPVK